MTVTDEMVELTFQTYYEATVNGGERASFRAALEAVAPMLIAEAFQTRPPALIKEALDKALNKARAEGMREMAKIIQTSYQDATVEGDLDHTAYGFVVEELFERAQELDPK